MLKYKATPRTVGSESGPKASSLGLVVEEKEDNNVRLELLYCNVLEALEGMPFHVAMTSSYRTKTCVELLCLYLLNGIGTAMPDFSRRNALLDSTMQSVL